jgi:phosphatidylglycerophosphate synthase
MSTRDANAGAYGRLRARAVAAFAVASGGTALAAAGLGPIAGLGAAYPLKAALVVPLLGAMAGAALAEHGRPALGPANAVTLARAALLGLVAGFLGDAAAEAHAVPLVAAGGAGFVLDAVDGRVARATGWSSPFGARLDMELDAITMVVLSALAWQLGGAGAWVLLAGALRYGFVAAGRIWPWLERPLYPTERRRFLCGVAIVGLLASMAPLPQPARTAGAAVAVLGLAGSFGADAAWLYARRRA